MSAARKLRSHPGRKTFHATLLVTRAEEWWVEAETAEEARAFFASGQGYRVASGERVHIELEDIEPETTLEESRN
jgi:hypothetical protein